MRDLRIAAGMTRAVVGDKAGNLERTRRMVRRAAREGAEFVLLPEAGLSGYTVRESMAPWAEPVPGPSCEAVVRMAGEFGVTISAGLIEDGGEGRCYIAQILAGPEGLSAKYRKTHLGPTEKTLFEPGDRLGLAEAGGIVFGIQLCYEGHFPEAAQAQALRGADAILISHASPREEPDQKLARWLRYLPARAYDNTVFVAAVNQVGDNGAGLVFSGVALIVGPKGEILAQAHSSEEGLVAADLKAVDLAAVREGRMGYFLPQRRPELYV